MGISPLNSTELSWSNTLLNLLFLPLPTHTLLTPTTAFTQWLTDRWVYKAKCFKNEVLGRGDCLVKVVLSEATYEMYWGTKASKTSDNT